MPQRLRTQIILFKIESTYATDATPTGANDGVLAKGVTWTPMEGTDKDRDLVLPHFGNQGTIPAELHGKLKFTVELAPSGTAGDTPAWGPLLRACSVAETVNAGVDVVYNPITDNPESATIYFWIEQTLFKMVGAVGNAAFMVDAQGIPSIEFEFTGLYVAPAETARDAPTLSGWQKPQLGTTANTPTFTLNGTSLVMRSFKMDLGNQVENRFLIGDERVIITDKAEAVECVVEAVPLSTFDPFALAAGQTDMPVVLAHGTGAGRIATLNIPTAQMQRPQGLQNNQNIAEWPLRLLPKPSDTGNDQWTLTLT